MVLLHYKYTYITQTVIIGGNITLFYSEVQKLAIYKDKDINTALGHLRTDNDFFLSYL